MSRSLSDYYGLVLKVHPTLLVQGAGNPRDPVVRVSAPGVAAYLTPDMVDELIDLLTQAREDAIQNAANYRH